MRVENADKNLRDAVHAIIVPQMADALIERRADLGDPKGVAAALCASGFGSASIASLMDRAVAMARRSGKGLVAALFWLFGCISVPSAEAQVIAFLATSTIEALAEQVADQIKDGRVFMTGPDGTRFELFI